MRAFRLAVVACACASVMVAGSAAGAGAAVTVGPDVTATPDGGVGCGGSGATTFSNASLASGLVSSPIDGVVVRWRASMLSQGSPPGGPTLRIVRATGPGKFTGAGSSAPAPAFTGVGGAFAARLAIRAGDRIGVDLPCQASNPYVNFVNSGTKDNWHPALLDGETPGRAPVTNPQAVLVNADVEADTDRDGFGDETQDLCPGIAGPVNGCPVADLALSETASPNPSPVHGKFSYLVQVHNNGPSTLPAATAIVADTLAPSVTPLSATSPGGTCMPEAIVRCPVVALAPGASTTITVTVRAIAQGGIANAATVSYGGDTNPANDTAGFTATVVPAPSISNASVSPNTWRLGSALPKFSRRAPVGTTIRFRLTQPARATLTFAQPRLGRKVGRRCVAQTRRNKHKRRCTIPNVRGTVSFNAHAGTNKIKFQGRLSRTKRLRPGPYRLTITATDSAGNRSRSRSTSFTIVR